MTLIRQHKGKAPDQPLYITLRILAPVIYPPISTIRAAHDQIPIYSMLLSTQQPFPVAQHRVTKTGPPPQ